MAENLAMHVDSDTFINANEQLQGQIEALNGILEEYQNLKTNVRDFVEDADSNFDNMQANVEENIKAVKGELAQVQSIKDQIQNTVDSMTEMNTNAQTILTQGVEAASGAVKAAIKLDELGII
ncbi:MAG: hypothetical protein LIO62_00600 [Clostridiales bacterium]|nr:hypothetical protein [Clostridiales bacterium]